MIAKTLEIFIHFLLVVRIQLWRHGLEQFYLFSFKRKYSSKARGISFDSLSPLLLSLFIHVLLTH